MITIRVTGLKELADRFEQAPAKFKDAMSKTMEASLLYLWSQVPRYPAKPPMTKYVRTGTLGRTLGSGMQGGIAEGQPDIYEVKEQGSVYTGSFGTRLEYAPYVIGERQARWNSHWWTLPEVAEKAKSGIEGKFRTMMETLARWLDRGQ